MNRATASLSDEWVLGGRILPSCGQSRRLRRFAFTRLFHANFVGPATSIHQYISQILALNLARWRCSRIVMRSPFFSKAATSLRALLQEPVFFNDHALDSFGQSSVDFRLLSIHAATGVRDGNLEGGLWQWRESQ
jgi:hypothetical protein